MFGLSTISKYCTVRNSIWNCDMQTETELTPWRYYLGAIVHH